MGTSFNYYHSGYIRYTRYDWVRLYSFLITYLPKLLRVLVGAASIVTNSDEHEVDQLPTQCYCGGDVDVDLSCLTFDPRAEYGPQTKFCAINEPLSGFLYHDFLAYFSYYFGLFDFFPFNR